jgi:hypothetical protein
MTKDDITRMARAAGFVGFDGENKCLREFANIVAAAQRKFDADLVDSNAMACENPIWRSLLQANAEAIRNGKVKEDDEL